MQPLQVPFSPRFRTICAALVLFILAGGFWLGATPFQSVDSRFDRSSHGLACLAVVMTPFLGVAALWWRVQRSRTLASRDTLAKARMLSELCQEIRMPMEAIIGMNSLLMSTPLAPDQHNFASTVQSSAESLLAMLNNILDYSRIDEGSLRWNQVDFELPALVEDAAEHHASYAHKKGVAVYSLIERSLPRIVNGDPIRLRQILDHLVGNAVRIATSGEIQVSMHLVSCRTSGYLIQCDIRSTSGKLPGGSWRDLFERRSQAPTQEFSSEAQGASIEIVVAKRLVEQTGGMMGMQAGDPAGFWFWFIVNVRPPACSVPLDYGTPLDNRTVLLLANSEFLRRSLWEQVRTLGGNIIATVDEQHAANVLTQVSSGTSKVDCVIAQTPCPKLVRLLRDLPPGQRPPLIEVAEPRSACPNASSGSIAVLSTPIRISHLQSAVAEIEFTPDLFEDPAALRPSLP